MKWVVALGVGLVLAFLAFERATDPEPTRQKAAQEAVVVESRVILRSYVDPGTELQLVDPLSPNRKVGKVYIYPNEKGWEVSGHYRRNEFDRWHPYLMQLDPSVQLVTLAVKDDNDRLIGISTQDEKFSAVP